MNTTPAQIQSRQSVSTFSPLSLGYAAEPALGHSLYSPQAVGIATFLGSPLAGAVVMAINYRRLGRPGSAINALVCGTLATAALIGLGFALPEHTPGYLIAFLPLAIMMKLAKSLQGELFDRHKLVGGKVASSWNAAGIGLLSLLALFAIIVGIVFATTPSTSASVTIGHSQIYYSGAATQADAMSLGKALTSEGYLNDTREVSVLLDKNASATTVKFVVNENAAQQANILDAFTTITQDIAPSIGGKPITLKLVSPDLRELQSRKVQ